MIMSELTSLNVLTFLVAVQVGLAIGERIW